MNNIENNRKEQWVIVMPDAGDPFFLKLRTGHSLSTMHDIECFYSKEEAYARIVKLKGQEFLDNMLEELNPSEGLELNLEDGEDAIG